MSKLIHAEIHRVLKSKLLYILLFISAFIGAASVFTVSLEADENSAVFLVTSGNLVMFMTMFQALFAGGISILLIASEFSSGVIRNKLIMGHKRRDILLSWTVIYTIVTILDFAVIIAAFFITLAASGADFSGVEAECVIGNILLLLLFMVKFQMFSLLMVCIYSDQKTAVIVYLLSNMTMLPIILLSYSGNSGLTQFFSRFFLGGFVNNFSLNEKTDKPWLTAFCLILLSLLYLYLANAYFKKKDLK